MKENLFIINPASARGRALRAWMRARKKLIESGIEFEECVTQSAGEGEDIARRAISQGVRRVIAAGGDGTISEVVNGYFDGRGNALNPDAAIGLIARGTGSDFQRSLADRSNESRIVSLLKSEARRIDAAFATFTTEDGATASRLFINLASFGLSGEVVSLVNGWRSHWPQWLGGRFRYAAAALAALRKYRNVEVEIELDGERKIQIESFLIAVANGRYAGGGMLFAPAAQLDDGLLNVIVTDRVSRAGIIRELSRIRRGGHLNNPKVTEHSASEVSVTARPRLAFEIDGEMVGYTPARIKILPGAVRFLTG